MDSMGYGSPHLDQYEKRKCNNNSALDNYAIEAKRRGISYGKLQSEETVILIRGNRIRKKWRE